MTFQIHDITGKKLVDRSLGYKRSGQHSFNFNGHGLTSGVYYYKIIGDGFKKESRMILLK